MEVGKVKHCKVCVITSSHNPFDTRIFKKECRSLSEAGFEVTVLAPTDTAEEEKDGIRVLGFGALRSRLERVKNLPAIARAARAIKANVYHVHEPELLLLMPFLKRAGSAFIYDAHENYRDAVLSGEKHWIPGPLKSLVGLILDVFEKSLARRADLVITAAADIEANFKGSSTLSIRNFAPMHIINDAFKQRREGPNLTQKREVAYAGSLTRARGIVEVIKALEFIDPAFDVGLTVAGPFHEPGLKEEVEGLPAFSRVRFMGWLPGFDYVAQAIKNADAAVMCFHPDPNLMVAVERSNKLFEYMGLGIPVVVSDLPGWREMISRHNCGLAADPMNPRDIADKLNLIFRDPEKAHQMGTNGREAVLEHYSWEREGEKLVSAYRSLLGPGPDDC